MRCLHTYTFAHAQVLYGVNQKVRTEDVDSPLCEIRPVKTVQLVVMTGDRGLCGGYNTFILKKVRWVWCVCVCVCDVWGCARDHTQ